MTDLDHRKRIKHFDKDLDAHFLTFSCYHRLPLLSKDRTREWLVEAINKARTKHQFDLWAWVIMPEHVHLLILPKVRGYKTSKILASIKKPVGYKAIQYLKAHAPKFLERLTVRNENRVYHHFWQVGPGVDNNLYEPESIHAAIAYIHENPVRRGLVERPDQWIWSSARDWSQADVQVPLRVDRTVPTLYITGRK
jgi:putative transposase